MTENNLISRGYVKYKNNETYLYYDYFYQLKVKDSKGIKYFINIQHHPSIHGLAESYNCELRTNEPFYIFEQPYIKLDELDEIEEKCEIFWQTFKCEYYELNN